MKTTTNRYTVCRYDSAPCGAPPEYRCPNSIKVSNPLNWCEAHRAKLPLWPSDDAPRTDAEALALDPCADGCPRGCAHDQAPAKDYTEPGELFAPEAA